MDTPSEIALSANKRYPLETYFSRSSIDGLMSEVQNMARSIVYV